MDTFLLYTLGVVSFIIAILVSIGLHELGHMIPAKKFGAKVSQYFVGFGPTLWSKKKGETEYGIKAYPLGGYVKIIGMLPPAKDHFENLRKAQDEIPKVDNEPKKIILRETNTGLFTSLISSAKTAEYETIDAADENRLFYKLSWWKKLIVMASGPMVNIALAFFCFLGVFATYGEHKWETAPGAPVVATVAECAIPPYGREAETCSSAEKSPAFNAGLKVGDEIIALNGKPVNSWEELTNPIQAAGAMPIELTVNRNGKELTLSTTTVELLRPTDIPGNTQSLGYLGVSPQVKETITYGGPARTVEFMGEKTVQTLEALAQIPGKLKNVFLAIVGTEERDPNGPVSIVGGARFSGEVAAYDSSGDQIQIGFTDKIAAFFMLVGTFNLFIGLFNLIIPLLPLDGGHVAGALWEGIKNGFAKIFGKATPAPVDIAKMLPVAYGFGLALFFLGLLLIVGDIIVPIKLFS